jgi:hypothetical protein
MRLHDSQISAPFTKFNETDHIATASRALVGHQSEVIDQPEIIPA